MEEGRWGESMGQVNLVLTYLDPGELCLAQIKWGRVAM